jgi:hypothetical protein
MPMIDRPSGFPIGGACRGCDRVVFGGAAWLISIRPPHDFGGDAHAAKNRAGKLGKEADCFQLERSPGGTCTHLKAPQRRTHLNCPGFAGGIVV